MWDGDFIAGPVPTFFAETPEGALNALRSDLAKAHYDMNRFHRIFVCPEHVDLKEAMELVKKPR